MGGEEASPATRRKKTKTKRSYLEVVNAARWSDPNSPEAPIQTVDKEIFHNAPFFFLLKRFARTAPSRAPAGVTDVDVSVSRRANLAGGPFTAVITECLEFSVTHNYTSPSVRGYFRGYQIYFQPRGEETTGADKHCAWKESPSGDF